ncbi:MAG: hypothetical protein AAF927_22095 [Bacteroidota bacterium]
MLKRSLFLILLFLLSFAGKAQEPFKVQVGPVYSEAQYQKWNLLNRKILLLQEGNIYAAIPALVKSKKTYGLDFIVFDENMQFLEQAYIPLAVGKRHRFRKIIRLAKATYIILSYLDTKTRSTQLLAQEIDLSQMKLRGELRPIKTYANLPFMVKTKFVFAPSPNLEKLLIMTNMESGDQGSKHQMRYYDFSVMDEALNPLWQYTAEETDPFKHYLDPILSNAGHVVCSNPPTLTKPLGYQKGQAKKFVIIAEGKLLAKHWISEENAYIIEHHYAFTDSGQTLICVGITGSNLETSKGFFMTKYSLVDGSRLARSFIPFHFQTLTKEREGKVKDLKIKFIRAPIEQDAYLLLQRADPALGQGATAGSPLFRDAYLLCASWSGELIWRKTIPQSAGTRPLPFLVSEDHINFFYHQSPSSQGQNFPDPQPLPLSSPSIKKGTQIKHVQIDWNGNQSEYTLIENSELGVGFWPFIKGAYEGQTAVFLGMEWTKARFIKCQF